MLALITVVVFLSLFFLCMLFFHFLNRSTEDINRRLGIIAGEMNDVSTSASAPKAVWRSLIRSLGRHFEFKYWSRLIERKLIQAGLPLKASEFLVICLAGAFIGGAPFLLLSGKMFLFILGLTLGFTLPLLILRITIERRVKAFNNQLGDCLVLMANSLRTGYSFMQAMQMVSREMLPPISTEFSRTLREINLGVTTEDALNNMAKRVNSDDLDLVMTAVLIQRQIGGNLAEILDNIAGTIRERMKIKGEIKTLTAQGRISGIIVGSLPIGLGMIIHLLNPGYIKVLFVTDLGQFLLGCAVFSQVLGIIAIRKIVNIEV